MVSSRNLLIFPKDWSLLGRYRITHLANIFGGLSEDLPGCPFSAIFSSLRLAASLQSVGLDTDVFGHGDWCDFSEYDSAVDENGRRFVAGRMTHELVFRAYETLGTIFFRKTRPVSAFQITERLGEAEAHRPLVALKEVMMEAYDHWPDPFKKKKDAEAAKAAIKSGSDAVVAADCVRRFRNALVHGRFSMLMPRDWGPDCDDNTAEEQTEVFRWQIRLCLLLIQVMWLRCGADDEVVAIDFSETSEDVVLSLHRQQSRRSRLDPILNY